MANPTDGIIQVSPDSTGKAVDTSVVQTTQGTVHRERENIADPSDGAGIAAVKNIEPTADSYGLVTRDLHGMNLQELVVQVVLELRAQRMILTSLACEDGTCKPSDFDPMTLDATVGVDPLN
jgi:hypothetical protein